MQTTESIECDLVMSTFLMMSMMIIYHMLWHPLLLITAAFPCVLGFWRSDINAMVGTNNQCFWQATFCQLLLILLL